MPEQEPYIKSLQDTPEVAASGGNRWMMTKRVLGTVGCVAVGIGIGWGHMNLNAAQEADAHARRYAAYERCAGEALTRTGADDKVVLVQEPFEAVQTLMADCEATEGATGGVQLETAADYHAKARVSAEAAVVADDPMDSWKVGLVWTALGGMFGVAHGRSKRNRTKKTL